MDGIRSQMEKYQIKFTKIIVMKKTDISIKLYSQVKQLCYNIETKQT